MDIKWRVKKMITCLREGKIIWRRPHGLDPYFDMKSRSPEESFTVVFDVGANDGHSAVEFVKEFSSANIYCFEPVKSTFEELTRNMSSLKAVKPFHLALGASEGTAVIKFAENNNSRCNSVSLGASSDGEATQVSTIDVFCENNNIAHIDFLKIDTEGFDLEVLKGSEKYLQEQRISFLQVEASMNPFNTKHCKFEDFKSYLESRGYVLFGVYDQTLEHSGENRLRFSNPVFISNKLA